MSAASCSECECLWGCLSAWRAGWKVNGIHKFPGQGTLESWPFGILGPAHFVLARILDSRPQFRACEREWICSQNSLTQKWAGKSIHSFAGSRLHDLPETWLDFSRFWWVCLEFYLKARIAKSLLFSVVESFWPITQSSLHVMIHCNNAILILTILFVIWVAMYRYQHMMVLYMHPLRPE